MAPGNDDFFIPPLFADKRLPKVKGVWADGRTGYRADAAADRGARARADARDSTDNGAGARADGAAG